MDTFKKYRKRLADIRAETQRGLNGKRQPSFLQATLTEQLQNLLAEIIDASITILGPSQTDFSVIGLGSMSRKEMCPFSDIEFAFLIKDPENKDYFRTLGRLLELKILDLGETRDLNSSGQNALAINGSPLKASSQVALAWTLEACPSR